LVNEFDRDGTSDFGGPFSDTLYFVFTGNILISKVYPPLIRNRKRQTLEKFLGLVLYVKIS